MRSEWSTSLRNGSAIEMDETSSTSSRSTESPPDATASQFVPIDARPIEGGEEEEEATTSVSMIAYKRAKDLPPSPDRAARAKRCLWEVDRDHVDSSITTELDLLYKEENRIATEKYNFDFVKDVPLPGSYSWEPSKDVPQFYKTKEVTSTKRKIRSEDEAHSSKSDRNSEEDQNSGPICPPAPKRPHLVSCSSSSSVSAPCSVIVSSSPDPVSTTARDHLSSPPSKKLCTGRQPVTEDSVCSSTDSSHSQSDTDTSTTNSKNSVFRNLEVNELSSTSDLQPHLSSSHGATDNLNCPTIKSCNSMTSGDSVTTGIPSSKFYSQSASKPSSTDLSECPPRNMLSTISGEISAKPVGKQKKSHSTKRSSPTSTQRSSSSKVLSPKYFR